MEEAYVNPADGVSLSIYCALGTKMESFESKEVKVSEEQRRK